MSPVRTICWRLVMWLQNHTHTHTQAHACTSTHKHAQARTHKLINKQCIPPHACGGRLSLTCPPWVIYCMAMRFPAYLSLAGNQSGRHLINQHPCFVFDVPLFQGFNCWKRVWTLLWINHTSPHWHGKLSNSCYVQIWCQWKKQGVEDQVHQ